MDINAVEQMRLDGVARGRKEGFIEGERKGRSIAVEEILRDLIANQIPLKDILKIVGMLPANRIEEIYNDMISEVFEEWVYMEREQETACIFCKFFERNIAMGILDGRCAGRKAGHREGLIEGERKGRINATEEVVRRMISNNISWSVILDVITGISKKKIKRIYREMTN